MLPKYFIFMKIFLFTIGFSALLGYQYAEHRLEKRYHHLFSAQQKTMTEEEKNRREFFDYTFRKDRSLKGYQ